MNYEKALREHWRFPSIIGPLTLEDLWDLQLKSRRTASLDEVARNLARLIRGEEDESFVDEVSDTKAHLTEQLGVVKHVIAVRLEERKQAEQAAARAEQKHQLIEILHEKRAGELRDLPKEELEERINAL